MKRIMLVATVLLSAVNIASADLFGTGANQFSIDFVTISGDTNPTSGYGIVNNDYRMGKYEISNDQFAMFASNNPDFTDGGVPANNVSWFKAAQFINFLNTSTGNPAAYKFDGNTFDVWESGDEGYDALNPFRNSNAFYFLPTEDEWVKAAYWNGTSLQTWATKAGESLTQGDGTSGTGWNYWDNVYATNPRGPWDVGSGSEELNGTFDMMGNVSEWLENPYSDGGYLSDSFRGIRGWSYSINYDIDAELIHSSSFRSYNYPYTENRGIGFRVASKVPEPASLVLLSAGCMMLRRRKR